MGNDNALYLRFRDPEVPRVQSVGNRAPAGDRNNRGKGVLESVWPAGAKPQECRGCPYADRRDPFVPGFGNLAGRHIIIGEKPGACEEGSCKCKPGSHETLKPFIGPSGQKINIGLRGDRSDCFITNVRKCNAYDTDKETKATSIRHCVKAYLQKEMAEVDAAQRAAGVTKSVVSPVGADAARILFGRGGMDSLHGTVWARAEVDAMMIEAEKIGVRFDDDEEGEKESADDR